MLRRILRLDLSGKLRSWRKRYRSSIYTFDYSHVTCFVSPHGERWVVSAHCYCSDPYINGFDMSEMARVYSSRRFRSRIEADAHLEAEIRNAARHHSDAGFYRYREVDYVRDGIIEQDSVTVHEQYYGGVWTRVDSPPGSRRCESCAFQTDGTICPQCGGLTR